MLENIEVLLHSSIRINKGKVIYIDPYNINQNYNDADLIFITHSHFDHYSPEDIEKIRKVASPNVQVAPQPHESKKLNLVTSEKSNDFSSVIKKENTVIVAPQDLSSRIQDEGFSQENIIIVSPNKSYEAKGIKFETVPAYNVGKQFHPKSNEWVGYILELDGVRYYIAGDTDANEDNKQVKCDVAFVPIGGTYTMTAVEAAEFINKIRPKIAVPIHYGLIVGTNADASKFVSLLDSDIEGRILIK